MRWRRSLPSDPDAEADDIEWSLGGPDAGAFEIDGGVLTFKESPDFEAPTDGDEDGDSAGNQGKGDNVYKVTVVASGGEQEVAVTVTDVDEPGSVSFDQPQPQATRGLKASFSDDDGEESPSWQWSRGASAEGPWTDIQGAITATRMPTADDVGSYLRATVTYEDKSGEKAISGVTAEPVEARTLANARPKFSDDIEAITVNENVSGAIGDPILATDDDNDVLLYAIDNDGADRRGQRQVHNRQDDRPVVGEERGRGELRVGMGALLSTRMTIPPTSTNRPTICFRTL